MALVVKPGVPTVAISAYRFTPRERPIVRTAPVVKATSSSVTTRKGTR